MDVTNLVELFNSIPATAWYTLGAAGGVSLLLQAVKHWVVKNMSDGQIVSILTFFSAAASVLETVVVNLQANPLILGRNTAMVVGLATLLYRFPIKPISNILRDAKVYRDSLKGVVATPAPAPAEIDAPALPESAFTAPEKRPVGEYATF